MSAVIILFFSVMQIPCPIMRSIGFTDRLPACLNIQICPLEDCKFLVGLLYLPCDILG